MSSVSSVVNPLFNHKIFPTMSDNFQTSCFSHSGSRLLPFLWFCLLAGLSACSWTKDDRGDCPSGFRIRLQPALHAQIQPGSGIGIITDEIDTLSLYVFDAQGQFVCLHTENRQSLTENGSIITLPLEYKDGDVYELVFWAGGDNRHYRIPQLTPGSSTRDELVLWLERDGDGRQDDELGHLWYGHVRLSRIQPSELTSVSVPMLKDSNRFIITLHDTSGEGLDADDYDFTLLADNGHLNADNEIITGNRVTYAAYHTESASETEPAATRTGEVSLARARLNTLRLLAGQEARLVVTDRTSGQKVVDVDLTHYLLMTRPLFEESSGVELSDQDYLDYEDQFNVIFYLTPMGRLEALNINGWIIRLNDAQL